MMMHNKGILSIKVNDGDECIAFDNVLRENESNYRLAITTCVKGTCLQLLD